MAATTDSFRSSLHGFNRMDVVQFIQKTTSEHELELRRLAEERTRQQEELEQQKKELAARQEESERQKQELSQLPARIARVFGQLKATERVLVNRIEFELAELREQNAALRQAQEPAGQPAAAVQKPRYDEMELTAYRRAEQTERMARERAAASAVRMRSAFEQAEEKLKARRQDITGLSDRFHADYDRLKQALDGVQDVFRESTERLHAAAELCSEKKPEEK